VEQRVNGNDESGSQHLEVSISFGTTMVDFIAQYDSRQYRHKVGKMQKSKMWATNSSVCGQGQSARRKMSASGLWHPVRMLQKQDRLLSGHEGLKRGLHYTKWQR
jgi:hypothetical protein